MSNPIDIKRKRHRPPGVILSLISLSLLWLWFWLSAELLRYIIAEWTVPTGTMLIALFVVFVVPMGIRILIDVLDILWLDGWLRNLLKKALGRYIELYMWMDGALVVIAALGFAFIGSMFASAWISLFLSRGTPSKESVDVVVYMSVTYTAWSFSYRGERHIGRICRLLRDKGTSEASAKRTLTSLALRKRVYQFMIPFYIISTTISLLGPHVPTRLQGVVNRPILESLLTLIVIDTYVSSYKPKWANID